MSDTPETDAKVSAHIGFYSCATVPAELCRKLERERDEARSSLKYITEYGTEEINAAVELRQKLAQALVERDEVREVAEQLYDAAAYGLAQWESATPATLSEKIVPALQAFQKLKAL
jgi:hypothetical protein